MPLFLVAYTFGCTRIQDQKPVTAVLGEKPVPEVAACSESPEAFLLLAQKGRKAATIMLFSGRINLLPVSGEHLLELQGMVKKKQWKGMKEKIRGQANSPISSRDYLFAAAKLGLVKEVYWVMPSRVLEYSDAERRVQMMLLSEAYGFSNKEVGEMQFSQGCVSGRLSGVQTHICGVETLPAVAGPVTLDIDAGFFPAFAEERGMNVLAGIKEFFEHCYKRKFAVEQAFVRKTQREETLSPLNLYIPDVVLDILNNPSAIYLAPSDRWVAWNTIATLLAEELPSDAVKLLREAEKRYPQDNILRMFGGISESLGGDSEAGMMTLSGLCEQEPETCYSLIYAGKELRKTKKDKNATNFFHEAIKLFDKLDDQEMVQKVRALLNV